MAAFPAADLGIGRGRVYMGAVDVDMGVLKIEKKRRVEEATKAKTEREKSGRRAAVKLTKAR